MAVLSDCQKTCSVTGIGGKDSVKGNRQGSLSRLITRRSDQNRKINIVFYFAILPQLVKKVRTDFFDKLSRMALRAMRLMAHGSRSSLSRCMSRYALGRPGAIRGNRFSVSDVGWML